MSSSNIFPCRGCDHRTLGCHSTCEVYIKCKQIYDEEKKIIQSQKEISKAIRDLNYNHPYYFY